MTTAPAPQKELRSVVWRCRKAIIDAARTDETVKVTLDEAARRKLTGDSCFVFLAAALVGLRQSRNKELLALLSERDVLVAKIKYLEARNEGLFSKFKTWIGGKLTWQRA